MINICIVGYGGMGKVYCQNFSNIKDCRVVAVVSSTLTQEKAGNGIEVFHSIEEAIANKKLDVVCICTPTYMHYYQIKYVLMRGLHVITEKPLVLHSEQAKELYSIAEAQGALLFVAQVVRFAHASLVLKELIQTKKFGKVLDASFLRLSSQPTWSKDNWVFDKSKSGLVPFDLHIHDLDLIVSLFGVPNESFFYGTHNENKTYNEHCRFLYIYNSFNVLAEASWYNAKIPFTINWRIYFENAVAACNGENVEVFTSGGDHLIYRAPDTQRIKTGINVPATSMYFTELSHFIQCIKLNQKTDVIKKEEILSVIEILEQLTN